MGNMGELKKFFCGKKICVTGHTGFKGSWLTYILHLWGADVVGIALPPHTNPNLFSALELSRKVRSRMVDIRNYGKVQDVFKREKPEIVFHLAAQTIVRKSYDESLRTHATNIIGTANILETIKDMDKIKSAVIITTDKVYANKETNKAFCETDPLGGHDPYSASKAAADLVSASYLSSYKLPLAIARSGNVIGGGDWSEDRLVPDIMRAVYEKKSKIIIRNPDAVRPWQHVLEPLYGYLLLAKSLYEKNPEAAGSWNFGPQEEGVMSVEDLLKVTMALLGRGAYEIMPDMEKHEAGILKLDISKARRILGWQPRLAIHDAVGSTVLWYKNYYDGGDTVGMTEQQIRTFFS